MERPKPLSVVFFKTATGNQPVRDFILHDRTEQDRKAISADISVVQKEFPMGMPFVEKIINKLWTIRSHIPEGICRIFFTVHKNTIILLHGFVKKTQKIPKKEMKIAETRLKEFRQKNTLK
jgi:phage-related protein